MDGSAEWRDRKEAVTLKLKQQELPHPSNREKTQTGRKQTVRKLWDCNRRPTILVGVPGSPHILQHGFEEILAEYSPNLASLQIEEA